MGGAIHYNIVNRAGLPRGDITAAARQAVEECCNACG
jgi:hypothetical protein